MGDSVRAHKYLMTSYKIASEVFNTISYGCDIRYQDNIDEVWFLDHITDVGYLLE